MYLGIDLGTSEVKLLLVSDDHQIVAAAGQRHGATHLDSSERVLRPAILWNDPRSAAECAVVTACFPALPAALGKIQQALSAGEGSVGQLRL